MSPVQHSEMGLSLNVPFRTTSQPLPTPPNSPEALPKSLKRQASRFRLPKILKRCHTVDSTMTIAPEKLVLSDLSSSGAPKCLMDLEPSGPACCASLQTRPPFLLVQPIAPMSTAPNEPLTRTASRKLRKMPKSYRNLRARKSDHQLNSRRPEEIVNPGTLLPSPLPSDSKDTQGHHGYFAFQDPMVQSYTEVDTTETSYEYENIVAGYCEDIFEDISRGPENFSVSAADQEQRPITPPQWDEPTRTTVERTPPTSNMSATLRSPKRDRSSSLSSEATWLSKSFASPDRSTCIGQLEKIQLNEKRLAEKSGRCCHLVEGPNDELPSSWTGERKASYATVIKPGKANDIWVPRSNSISFRSAAQPSPCKLTEMPRTPERKLSEISAFSPWDSPVDRRASAHLDRDREGQLRKVATYGSLRYSFKDYTPTRKPLFPPRKSSLAPLLSVSPISMYPSSSTSTLTSDFNLESITQSPSGNHQTSLIEHEAWMKCEELAKILDDLEQSIDDYPSTLLQLSSPAILQLRAPNSLDELHISRLRRIFPATTSPHLSALAALLIAQSYLTNLGPVAEPAPSVSKYSRLASRSNESLNHIPTKAIATLGIRLANVTSVQERARALRKRAVVVEAALHGLVQKVMVRVCGRWDEVVWRSLLCLVETVEQGW